LDDRTRASFRKLPNVTYHGPFDGFEALPVEDYDVFLNNSQWEGLPNVLIEALSCGLPIVSSNVGGIGELVRHEETGLLVTPYDDVDQYVAALERLYRDPRLARRLADEGRQLVAERHSWEAFAEAVRAVPGYVEVPASLPAQLSA
jgi:glycosyltransferase involved in cell wall biosynthesis